MSNSFETGLFLGLAAGVLAGGVIAGMLAYDAGLERGKKMAPPNKLVMELRPANTLIQCTTQDWREFQAICHGRKRMGKVTYGR